MNDFRVPFNGPLNIPLLGAPCAQGPCSNIMNTAATNHFGRTAAGNTANHPNRHKLNDPNNCTAGL